MKTFIIFIVSLIALVVFFLLKHIEIKNGRVLFGGKCRYNCNTKIEEFEAHCTNKYTLERTIALLKNSYNTVAHKMARITANIAKKIEWRARSAAHKSAKAKQDGEQIRENGYLKDVQDHKDSLDTVKVAQEAKL